MASSTSRRRVPETPILIVTARDAESDKVIGLESGSDDYLAKPFGIRELVARVGAIMGRHKRAGDPDSVRRTSSAHVQPASRAMKKQPETNLKTLTRREALGLLGATGAAFSVFGCGDGPTSPSSTTTTTVPAGTSTCSVTPTETSGPFPSLTDLIRSDIREGKSGTTLTLTITVVDTSNGCSAVANANVEIWQCDAAGNYSEYGTQTAQTYLRGIQTTNGNGEVTFTTVYPGWYQGRATHIHAEVVRNGSSVKVTQIAFPESTNAAVYATGVYASRGSNPTSNSSDNIFADSLAPELATVTGDPTNGYTATFRIGI